MAFMAVSFAIDKTLPFITKEVNLLKGVHKEFAEIKLELESIQAFLKDADRKAAAERDDTTGDGVKTWVKQVREAAFRIEYIIDNYIIHLAQQPRNPGCSTSLHGFSHFLKTLKQRHRIASGIKDIKTSVGRIKEIRGHYGVQSSLERGSSSTESRSAKWYDPRLAALQNKEDDIVGFEVQRKELIDLMVKGREELTVISVVGMGGQGKTTFAKYVFDSKEVGEHFKHWRVWIEVPRLYTVKGLLTDMLVDFYKKAGVDPPQSIFGMDQQSLTDEVKTYLLQKRYVVVFDNVWNVHFWNDIEFAVNDNKNGSKILITTRKVEVAMFCKRSSFIEVFELPPLTKKQSLELFNKKAFKIDYGGCCPDELIDVVDEIVEKCKGLPLAIVAMAGCLSTREKNLFEWQKFRDNLSLELNKDTHLIGINEILGLSYDDLPYYLKACFLYFGIYPEDYEVKPTRMIRQWIAEGFVNEEKGKTLEEVAEGYLTELIRRSLVQVSSIKIDGKAKSCRVHDLIRDLILQKIEDLNFCKHITEDGQSFLSEIIPHISVTTTSFDLMLLAERRHVRSLHVFRNKESGEHSTKRIPKKYMLLKVLDFESAYLFKAPKNLGNLIHLKYLSFRHSNNVLKLSKSIGMLQNLETLDVRDTLIRKLPKEIGKLRKLRHLMGFRLSLYKLKDGIGEMTSLQTLRSINLRINGAEVVKELGKLKQTRDVQLLNVRREDVSILSSSIDEMKHMEKLLVTSNDMYVEFIDLDLSSPPTKLRKLELHGKLQKLPKWILELQNLVVLKLLKSELTEDLMQSLESLQHSLLILKLGDDAYIGSHDLHFQDGRFQKLKELYVGCSGFGHSNIVIDKGALPSLKKLDLDKDTPTGIKHLEKLEVLYIWNMEVANVMNKSLEDWNWMMEHVPRVEIHTHDGHVIRNSTLIF